MDAKPDPSAQTTPIGFPSSDAPENPTNEQNNSGPSFTGQAPTSQQSNIISTRGGQVSRNMGYFSSFQNNTLQTWGVFDPSLANSSLANIAGRINISGKRSWSTAIGVIILFFAVLVTAAISPFVSFILAIVLGIFLIYLGYSYLSKHMLVANTPISKIGSAPIGFGVFQVRFNPEDGEPLISPLSKTPCSFYMVSLSFVSKGSYIIASFYKGKKSTLYDGTGHLVTDFGSLPMLKGKYQIHYLNQHIIEFGRFFNNLPAYIQPFKDIINNSIKTGKDPDFATILNKIHFSTSDLKIDYPSFDGNTAGWQLMEYCLPTNLDYIAAGFVDHTDAQLNGKPISKLVPDPRSKIFLLEPEGQVELTKKELNNAILSFIFGFIFLSVAFLFATYHSLYQCLIVTYSNGITYCHLLSGSVIPLS